MTPRLIRRSRPSGLLFVVLLAVFSGAATSAAQQAATAAPPQNQAVPSDQQAQTRTQPQRQQSPAMKALNEANAIKDQDAKIGALRKVVADFGKTPQADQAQNLLLTALVKKGDTKQVDAQARAMVSAADDSTRSRICRFVANELLTGEMLLSDAETYARTAVNSLDEKSYVEARKKEAAARAASRQRQVDSGPASAQATAPAAASPAAQPGVTSQGGVITVNPSGPVTGPIGDEVYIARFKSEKQAALTTLGQIYSKRGKTALAEKTLREGYLLDKRSAGAATAALKLAEFAKSAGRTDEQVEYLAGIALAGRLTPQARADLESSYRQQHNGSLAGLDEWLDARYEKDRPKAPEVKAYERTADRTDRLVLAEVFTGSGCPPCVAADLAFESAMQRYGTKDLAVLMYHLHVPRPDPMTNPFTQTRAKFYSVRGVPTFAIDGKVKSGGGGAEAAPRIYRNDVESVIEKRLATAPDLGVTLSATQAGQTIRAKVDVAPGASTATHLRLHLALVEDLVRYSGENGIRFHPMVVRSMAVGPAAAGAPAAATPPAPAQRAEAVAAVSAAAVEGQAEVVPDTTGDAGPILGFVIEPGKATSVEYTFDLAKVAADGLANLEDLEQHSTRFPNYRFVEKKHVPDPTRLALVAFVQDEDSKQVQQAAVVSLRKP